MHSLRLIVSCLFILAAMSSAVAGVDLAKIDRTVGKEPQYKSQPKYCLLVFGPEAQYRVWLVIDGEALYWDLNGNGDLTEEYERFPVKKETPDRVPDDPVASRWYYLVPRDIQLPGGRWYTLLTISRDILKKGYNGNSRYMREVATRATNDPDHVHASVTLTQMGGRRDKLVLVGDFASRPQDAPVYHVDGPLTFHSWYCPNPELKRGPAETELTFSLGCIGSHKDTFSYRDPDDIPADIHPVADIEFPARREGVKPIHLQVPLKSRC